MPEDPKLAEFRNKNIELLKEVGDLKAKYEGIDPATVAADKAKLAELEKEKAKPNERVTELEAQLASEKAARASAQAAADASVLKTEITARFIKAGGRGSALEFMVAKAAPLFEVVNGALVGKGFDPDQPGTKLTPERFIAMQVKESDFAFLPSSGGGANPARGGGGATGGAKELRDPTAQQLGEHSQAIKDGKMRVVYSGS